MCADKYSFKTTDCLLSLYQYTQCIGIHRIHGIAQKVIDECPILILDIPMYFCHGAAVLVEKSDIAFCFLCSKCNEAGLKFVFMRIFQEPNLCATQRFGS